MKHIFLFCLAFSFILNTASCQSGAPYPELSQQRTFLNSSKRVKPVRLLDSVQIINDIKYLASETCAGRRPGTEGHTNAANRIMMRIRTIGLDSFDNALVAPFEGREINGTRAGKNIIGWLKGKRDPESFLVISSHYDHMGVNKRGETMYGADDNASGVACMLALAKYFKQHRPDHSIIFAAFDREESGLEGAMHYVAQLEEKNKLTPIKFNLNLDMVARSDSNELFAAGIRLYPTYKYAIEEARKKTNTKLLMGHDFGSYREDWTKLSDQYAFHKKNIPFIFVSVEDHADYHKPTDTIDRINLSRFIENCNAILMIAKAIKLN